MPLRGVGPLSGGYGVPTFESRTQSIPPTTQNAGRHFSKYRETPHSGQGCGVRKKNHDSHFLIPRDTIHTTTGSRTAEKCSEIAEKCWKNAQKCRKNAQKSFSHVFYMRCFAGNLAKISQKSRENLRKSQKLRI